jgi:predicted transposase/invertase (TIGR01784 family)
MAKNLVRFDWAIKRLLRQKANFGILEGFLSELLKENITIKNIGESEGNKETVTDKYNRVDVLVLNAKGELIIIELQVELEHDYFHRILYGTSKAITEYIKTGDAYERVKKVYSVSIVYFELGQGEDYVYHGQTQFEGIHQHDILALSKKQKEIYTKTTISDIFPEYYILKINNFNDVAKDGLDEWIYFLKHSKIKASFKAKGLKEADEVMDEMKLTPKQRREYNRYMETLRSNNSYGNTIKAEIAFARREAEMAIQKAEVQAEMAIQKAEVAIQKAEVEAKMVIQKAEVEAEMAIQKAEVVIQKAEVEAKMVIQKAEMEAKIVIQKAEIAETERKIASVKNFIAQGLPLEMIAKGIGLSLEEVKVIAEQKEG